jgi:hypothetical protein
MIHDDERAVDRILRVLVGFGVVALVFFGPETFAVFLAIACLCLIYGVLGHRHGGPHATA